MIFDTKLPHTEATIKGMKSENTTPVSKISKANIVPAIGALNAAAMPAVAPAAKSKVRSL
ncbi:hypothetical protein D9M68_559110 [compost metagenome]